MCFSFPDPPPVEKDPEIERQKIEARRQAQEKLQKEKDYTFDNTRANAYGMTGARSLLQLVK